jgi:hypothetical protein
VWVLEDCAAVDFVFVIGEIVKMSDRLKPLVLLVHDGYGRLPEKECNAIATQAEHHETFGGSFAYENGLGEALSNNSKRLSLGETEKYSHAIYFPNGGKMRLIADHDNHPLYRKVTGECPAAQRMSQILPVYVCGTNPRVTGRSLSSLVLALLDLSIFRPVETTGKSLLAVR